LSAPQTITLQRFGYTAPDATVTGIQAGRWEWSSQSRCIRMFCAFTAGNGPSSGNFITFLSRNGTHVGSITCPSGNDEFIQTLGPVPTLVSGDLITFEISTVSGATGVVTFGFDYY
jgi:hypothetical protein